jgi:PAS domain S-box-containing protein
MQQAEIFLSLLAEGGNTGFWTYSDNTKTYVPDAVSARLLGCSASPVSGLPELLAGVHAQDLAELQTAVQRAIALRSGFQRLFRVQGRCVSERLSMRGRWTPGAGPLDGIFVCLVERAPAAPVQEETLWKERVGTVLAASPVTLFEQDLDLRYRWVFAPRMGLQGEAMIGRRAIDFLEPDTARALDHAKQQVLHSGQPERVQLFMQAKGHPGSYFDIYMAPARGPDGKISGVITVSIDIAESFERERRFLAIFERAPMAIVLSRMADGVIVNANQHFVDMFGYSREQSIGATVDSLALWLRPEQRAEVIAAMEESGQVRNLLAGYRHKSGRTGLALISGEYIQLAGEKLLLGMVSDVTELERTRQALHNVQLRFSSMMESNVVGIFIAGPQGEIFESNDYFLNLLGLQRQTLEAGHLNWRSLTSPETLGVSVHGLQQMLHGGGSLPYEKSYLHADGHRVPALVALSQLSAEPLRAIAIVVDISDLKATQRELQRSNAQLLERSQAAERAEAAKTLFLSSVSHELRTPLHTMLGHVRLMRKAASGEDLQQLSVVERSSTHLLRLIEDLLEYNHATISPDRLEPELVVMEGFLASLQLIGSATTADTGNQFFIQLSDELPAAMVVDEARLTQVLRILIDNACKYTRAGALIFSLSCDGERRQVDGADWCRMRFSVEDNGRGIDASDVQRIFEPLQRGRNAEGLPGLGLGLAIATQWVQRMGSRITLETRRGLGSHFAFVLDLAVSFDAVPSKHDALRGLPHAVPAQQALLLHALPDDDLNTLGELIRMGRLGRLRDWAQALKLRHPQHREAADSVAELAANADLDALEILHARWASLDAQSQTNQLQGKH